MYIYIYIHIYIYIYTYIFPFPPCLGPLLRPLQMGDVTSEGRCLNVSCSAAEAQLLRRNQTVANRILHETELTRRNETFVAEGGIRAGGVDTAGGGSAGWNTAGEGTASGVNAGRVDTAGGDSAGWNTAGGGFSGWTTAGEGSSGWNIAGEGVHGILPETETSPVAVEAPRWATLEPSGQLLREREMQMLLQLARLSGEV